MATTSEQCYTFTGIPGQAGVFEAQVLSNGEVIHTFEVTIVGNTSSGSGSGSGNGSGNGNSGASTNINKSDSNTTVNIDMKGETVYIEKDPPPRIYSVSPTVVFVEAEVTFNVNGEYLPGNLLILVDDFGAFVPTSSGTKTLKQFNAKPLSVGTKQGRIYYDEKRIYAFTVDVVEKSKEKESTLLFTLPKVISHLSSAKWYVRAKH